MAYFAAFELVDHVLKKRNLKKSVQQYSSTYWKLLILLIIKFFWKLEVLGFENAFVRLIGICLREQKQVVKMNGFFSERATIINGVPQGGVLEPTLFLMYINGLTFMDYLNVFADDSCVPVWNSNLDT